MASALTSLHHVTATVGEAQKDVDFYTRLLGLRLVKRTVNFDNSGVYHFYYGDAQGSPGTIMTTFPYAGKNVRIGRKGAGQVTVTSFSVPAGSLDYWRTRLAQHGVEVQEQGRRFAEEVIAFTDPAGLDLELIGTTGDPRRPWTIDGIEAAHAVRGIHSVTLTLSDTTATLELLQDAFGLWTVDHDGDRIRLGISEGDPGQVLDLLHVPGAERGLNGIGTVHHVAMAIPGEEAQNRLRDDLHRRGFSVTDVRDRKYFRSIYVREPGGVLLEVATEGPGFLVDEEEAQLGGALKLPEWEEPRREEIEAALPQIRV